MSRSRAFLLPKSAPLPLGERWTIADEAFEAFLVRPRSISGLRRLLLEKEYGGTAAEIKHTKERIYDMETERLRAEIRSERGRVGDAG